MDFEQVSFKADTYQIGQGPGPAENATCPTRWGICSGRNACRPNCRGARGANSSMKNIDREHPEYIARKAMWKQYKDLYAGGEQLPRVAASEYLVRPAQRAGRNLPGTAQPRCSTRTTSGRSSTGMRATLMRREPVLLMEGSDPAAKSF